MAEDYNTPDVSLLIYVHNRPGVLAKVASAFHRRAMNIQTLAVEPTEQPERSKMLLRVAAPRPDLERVALAIDNLVDVISVELI